MINDNFFTSNFINGTCRRGDNCLYDHTIKKPLCHHFINGHCNKGDTCPFSHIIEKSPC